MHEKEIIANLVRKFAEKRKLDEKTYKRILSAVTSVRSESDFNKVIELIGKLT